MSAPDGRGFWVTNHVANPVLRVLLRSSPGRRWGRRLAVLRYCGRRTGETHELVVQYVRDGDHVWIMPAQPDRKRWWRNMRQPLPVDIRLGGHDEHGVAQVTTRLEEPDGFATYVKAFPKTPNTDESAVMVRVDLSPATTAGPSDVV
jgi:F420H(2)-dependent quinone reductase